jgi:hypothetical protein
MRAKRLPSTMLALLPLILVCLLTGCVQAPVNRLATRQDRVADLCGRENSDLGRWQCDQYYANHPEIDPTTPTTFQSGGGNGDVNPLAAVMLLQMMQANRPPPAPVYVPVPAPPPTTMRLQTMCNQIGQFTYCN